jgi:Fe-S-cluster containining protein
MKSCKQCGDCCQNIILKLADYFDEDDIRWIEYHNLEVVEEKGKQFVKISNPCLKLVDNKCSIYKDRPEVCQLYICQKSL